MNSCHILSKGVTNLYSIGMDQGQLAHRVKYELTTGFDRIDDRKLADKIADAIATVIAANNQQIKMDLDSMVRR